MPDRDLADPPRIELLHEMPSPSSDLDGTPTPRSWVARMTKRRALTGARQERLRPSRGRNEDRQCLITYHPMIAHNSTTLSAAILGRK
jgi:hypothetical protein